ncbi:unnamed protein product [Hymenolepis diminuta]|nr:unnamed protein product [Hymenolepis diminuta]
MTKGNQKYLIFLLLILAALSTQLSASPSRYKKSRYLSMTRRIVPKPTEDANDSRKDLQNMIAATRKYCSCGMFVLQSRFCHQDFVILAYVNVEKRRPYWGMPHIVDSNHSSPGFPYSGTIIPIKVIESIKGPLMKNQHLNIYFTQGSYCGVLDDAFPRRSGKYILSGFRIEFPECKDISCHLPREIFAVTRCGWSQPAEDLTLTQIGGLFLKGYNCGKGECTMLLSILKPKNSTQVDRNVCYFDYKLPRCYSRYTMCVRVAGINNGPPYCTLRSIRRLSPTPNILRHIPSEFHKTIRNAQSVRVSDEDLFTNCLLVGSHSGL